MKPIRTWSEWWAAYRKLDESQPLPGPRFRSKFCATGAAGISTPLPKPKRRKVVSIKKRRA